MKEIQTFDSSSNICHHSAVKRIQEIDALRGLALLGILIVNIFVFHAPYSHYGEFYGAFEGVQTTTVDLMVNYAGGKFLFIFAFLFGYGAALQRKSKGDQFRRYFPKRLLVLLLFGTLHITLFWFGDILASYALLGFLLIPFINSNRTVLLALACFFVFFRPLYYLGTVYFNWPLIHMEAPAELSVMMQTFQGGSYWGIFQLRMKEFWAFMPENLVWYIPKTLGLFYLGIYAERIDLIQRIKTAPLKSLLIVLLLLVSGIAWYSTRGAFFGMVDLKAEPLWRPFFISLNVIFETAVGISYILGFSLFFQRVPVIANTFARAGKMALTNYIMQSLICVLIFYGFGLGNYGKLLPTELIILSLAVYSFNLLFSALYLRFYSNGPLELIWRKLALKM